MGPLAMGIGAGAGLLGGILGNKSQEDMLDESRKLPDWLRPYIKGAGDIPEYLTETPKINTNWLDHILALGSGNPQSNWAPMTSNSPWFNQDQTFTPQQGGGQFGSLPPGMQQTAPPPAAPHRGRLGQPRRSGVPSRR